MEWDDSEPEASPTADAPSKTEADLDIVSVSVHYLSDQEAMTILHATFVWGYPEWLETGVGVRVLGGTYSKSW